MVLALLLLVGTATYFSVRNHNGHVGGVAELDGYYYYIYLRSVQMDGGIDFSSEYRDWGNPFKFGQTSTGYARNIFGVGPAILWAPFFLLTHLLVLLLNLFGFPLWTDGMSRFHQVGTFYGSMVMGWLAVVASYRAVRHVLGREGALWATVGAALAGPLPFYCLTLASFSHAPATMAASVQVLCWVRWRGKLTFRRWLLFGAATGLVVLARPACVPFALLPTIEAVRLAWPALKRRQLSEIWSVFRGPLAGGAVALLVFSPQMAAWIVLFGRPWLVPQGEGFMRWTDPAWASTLFSPRNGLFVTAPLLSLAAVGLLLAIRRHAAVVLPLLLVVTGMLLVNGAAYDWWGWGFSARRYTCLLPIWALGLGFAIRLVRGALVRNPARTAAGLCGAVILLAVLFNLQWMFNHSKRFMTWTNLRSSQALYMTVTHRLVDRTFRTVGNPMSLPASLPFTVLHGGSPYRYDNLSGHYVTGEAHATANPASKQDRNATVVLADPRHRSKLSDAFGYGKSEDGVQFVPLRRPKGRIFLPINRPGELTIFLGGKALFPGTRLRLRFNGAPLSSHDLPGTAWSMVQAKVPADRVERGINRLDLVHELPKGWDAPGPRTIGATGVTSPVDLAAVSGGAAGGNFCELWVNNEKVSHNQRGINLAIVDKDSGKLLNIQSFDTYLRRAYWREMARHLDQFPQGSPVAVCGRDEYGRYHGRDARQALARIGLTTDLSEIKGQGDAAIGVLGAKPGTALESAAAVGHARAKVGRPPPPWREVARYRVLQVQ